MEHALFEANLNNNPKKLDEVADLLRSIKDGWDGIREEVISQQQAV
jgi:flagellar protein FliS